MNGAATVPKPRDRRNSKLAEIGIARPAPASERPAHIRRSVLVREQGRRRAARGPRNHPDPPGRCRGRTFRLSRMTREAPPPCRALPAEAMHRSGCRLVSPAEWGTIDGDDWTSTSRSRARRGRDVMPSLRLLPAALVVLAFAPLPASAQTSGGAEAAPPSAEAPSQPLAPRAEAPRSRMPGIYVTPVPPLRTPPAESRAPAEPHEGGCQYIPRKLDLLV